MEIRRSVVGNRLAVCLIGIPLDPDYVDSIQDLTTIRREVHARARHPWWNPSHVDSARLRELESRIRDLIGESQTMLKRSLLTKLRSVRRDPDLTTDERQDCFDELEEEIWIHLERDRLNAEQHRLLVKLLAEE